MPSTLEGIFIGRKENATTIGKWAAYGHICVAPSTKNYATKFAFIDATRSYGKNEIKPIYSLEKSRKWLRNNYKNYQDCELLFVVTSSLFQHQIHRSGSRSVTTVQGRKFKIWGRNHKTLAPGQVQRTSPKSARGRTCVDGIANLHVRRSCSKRLIL
ncbi:hypothetical protein [Herbaspirillum sp. CAH-3]|uniref:hypothetical protein n=1 Tax=Herbaspirillum sp. CAH-3 TaxID=2605746 RepID=UPI0012ACEDAB|nr:hypothetical protein [Herbaspirillum sp. CAH-3]MRT28662.1 hypothetical protein [Herbaspirillum sp. CAH-3]